VEPPLSRLRASHICNKFVTELRESIHMYRTKLGYECTFEQVRSKGLYVHTCPRVVAVLAHTINNAHGRLPSKIYKPHDRQHA